jgi:hypothetical protein
MASSGKKKTTFAKLARESRLRERRAEKAAKKDARRRAAENPESQVSETSVAEEDDAGAVPEPTAAAPQEH